MPCVVFEKLPPPVETIRDDVAVNVEILLSRESHESPWTKLARVCNMMQAAGAWTDPARVKYLSLSVLRSDDGTEGVRVEWHARDYIRPL